MNPQWRRSSDIIHVILFSVTVAATSTSMAGSEEYHADCKKNYAHLFESIEADGKGALTVEKLKQVLKETELISQEHPGCKEKADRIKNALLGATDLKIDDDNLSPKIAHQPSKASTPDSAYPKVDLDFQNWSTFKIPEGLEKSTCDTTKSRNAILQNTKLNYTEANSHLECYTKSVKSDHVQEVTYFIFEGKLVAVRYQLDYSSEVSGVSDSGKINTVIGNSDIIEIYNKKYGKFAKRNSWEDSVFSLRMKFTENLWTKGDNEAHLLQQENFMGGQWVTVLRYISYVNLKLKKDALQTLETKGKTATNNKKKKKKLLQGDAP